MKKNCVTCDKEFEAKQSNYQNCSKECTKIFTKKYKNNHDKNYREKNKDKIKKRKKEYYENNKDKFKNYHHEYYLQNKDKIDKRNSEYIKNNIDKVKEYRIEYNKEYYRKNIDKLKECIKKYREENKEELKKYSEEYYNEHKDAINEHKKQYRKENPDKISEYNFQYKKENKNSINKNSINKNRREYQKNRRKNDVEFKLKSLVSGVLLYGLKRIGLCKNGKSTSEFIDYTWNELAKHIESLWEDWMTWDNHGVYNKSTWDDNDFSTWTWQLDHIIPKSTFDFSDEEEIKKCCSLSNLRPYSAKQNLLDGVNRTRHKNNKIPLSQ